MKKYPVHYKGKKYEVRWEIYFYEEIISIYEVKQTITSKKYKQVYFSFEDEIKEKLKSDGINEEDSNFYIEEVKLLFKKWKDYSQNYNKIQSIREAKKNALANWDGVID